MSCLAFSYVESVVNVKLAWCKDVQLSTCNKWKLLKHNFSMTVQSICRMASLFKDIFSGWAWHLGKSRLKRTLTEQSHSEKTKENWGLHLTELGQAKKKNKKQKYDLPEHGILLLFVTVNHVSSLLIVDEITKQAFTSLMIFDWLHLACAVFHPRLPCCRQWGIKTVLRLMLIGDFKNKVISSR